MLTHLCCISILDLYDVHIAVIVDASIVLRFVHISTHAFHQRYIMLLVEHTAGTICSCDYALNAMHWVDG